MITKALQHCAGIGPVRLAELHDLGIESWIEVIEAEEQIPAHYRQPLVAECRRCLAALDKRDIRYFVDHFSSPDKWRIIQHFPEDVSFFDIETTGLEYDAPITVIACWHHNRLHSFVEHENLDEFLGLLDEICLLASFNGASFDVPRLLEFFHIPELPCPHLDLRWASYHRGYRGGLKQIASRLGISRPDGLEDVDGSLAVRLWQEWIERHDHAARRQLIRYCASDVLLLVILANRMAGRVTDTIEELWTHLPAS